MIARDCDHSTDSIDRSRQFFFSFLPHKIPLSGSRFADQGPDEKVGRGGVGKAGEKGGLAACRLLMHVEFHC